MTPTETNAIQAAILALGSAHQSGDRDAWLAAWTRMQQVLKPAEPAPDAELCRVAVSDWRIEDWGDTDGLDPSVTGPGEIVVSRGAYGITVSARPPGSDTPHSVDVEFDRGALKLNVFKANTETVLAIARVDNRGVHVENGVYLGSGDPSLASVFAGDHGAWRTSFDWSPEPAPVTLKP